MHRPRRPSWESFPDPAHWIHGSRVRVPDPAISRAGRPDATGRLAHGSAPPIHEPTRMEAAANPLARRILLAVDQSGSSNGASREAIRLAREEQAALIVLSVVEPHNLHLPGGLRRRVDQERDRLASGALDIVRAARDAGVQADVPHLGGRPGGDDPRGVTRGAGRHDRARVAAPDEPPPHSFWAACPRRSRSRRPARWWWSPPEPVRQRRRSHQPKRWNASPTRSAEPPSIGIRALTAPAGTGR